MDYVKAQIETIFTTVCVETLIKGYYVFSMRII